MFYRHHNCPRIKQKVDEADYFKTETEDMPIGIF
jgi:hypothetical protein